MKFLKLLSLFLLALNATAQISTVTVPHIVDSASVPKISYVDDNDAALQNGLNETIDTVNAHLSSGKLVGNLTSTGDQSIIIDSDNNGSNRFFIADVATDTLLRILDNGNTLIDGDAVVSGDISSVNAAFSGTLGITGVSTFDTVSITGPITASALTASRLMATDGSSGLASVSNLASWVAGTSNQVSIANDGDGTITLSTPQDIATGSSPSFTGLTVSGLTASLPVFTNGSSVLTTNAITGTGNVVMSASPTLSGAITLGTATMGGSGSGLSFSGAAATFSSTLGANGKITSNSGGGGGSSSFLASSNSPSYEWNETDAGVDSKNWDLIANAGILSLRALNDTYSTASTILSVNRSGATPSTFSINIPVSVGGNITMGTNSIGGAGTGLSFSGANATHSGTFTANGGSVFNESAADVDFRVESQSNTHQLFVDASVNAVGINNNTPTPGTLDVTGAILASGNVDAANLSTGNETFTYDEGTFTATGRGFSGTDPTSTASYVRIGSHVTIHFTAFNGTSDSTGYEITGIPAGIQPSGGTRAVESSYCTIHENSTSQYFTKFSFGTLTDRFRITYWNGSIFTSTFTASGTKGLVSECQVSYMIN